MAKSELEVLVSQIKEETKQISINKVDEVRVMQTMLNDREFTLGVYDKNNGYIGQRSPHNEAVMFAKDIIKGSTGLDNKEAEHLAENYEFTKKNANFLLTNMRDFLNIYGDTGRKINIMQNANTEACLFKKDIPSTKRIVPNPADPNKTKQVTTNAYTKLVATNKCPKYNDNIDDD